MSKNVLALLPWWFSLYTISATAEAEIGKYNSCDRSSNGMGTVLFTAADVHKQCWSPDEIAILTTRMILEDLLPDITILKIDSNAYVEDTVDYFRLLIEVVKSATHGRKRHITLKALTDLLGGYLQYAVLPIARHAYYAGLVDYTGMEKLIQLFEELKWFLRTNGQGWSKPIDSKPVFEIQPINFDSEAPKNVKSCCSRLIYYENEQHTKEDNCTVTRTDVFFPSPFFDTKVRPSAIAVPFRRYALRNIESRKAAYLLQKFFVSAVQCMKEKRSSKEAIVKFQNDFFSWIEKEVLTKLHDDKFYSAFGGILRVEETLRNLGAVTNSGTTCGPEGEEEVGPIPQKGATKNSKSSIVLLVMLISIIFWFILGTAFICYRMRKNQRQQKEEPQSPDFNTSSSVSSRWSLFSKSSNSTPKLEEETRKLRNQSSTPTPKTTPYSSSLTSECDAEDGNKSSEPRKTRRICYPPVPKRVRHQEGPAVIDTKTTMKKLPSITEVSEYSANRPAEDTLTYSKFGEPARTSSKDDLKKVSFKKRPSKEYTQIPCPNLADRSTSMSNARSKQATGTAIDECWCDQLGEEATGAGQRNSKRRSGGESPGKGNSREQLEKTRGSTERRKDSSLDTNGERDSSDTVESTVIENVAAKNGRSNVDDEVSQAMTVSVPKQDDYDVDPSSTADNSVAEISAAEESTVRENSWEDEKTAAIANNDSHAYACHSSLTGAYAHQKRANDDRYIFGYDFQSSTSSDFSDEDTDLRTSTSK